MNIYTQKITPEIAKAMLSKNTMNRTASKYIIQKYASDMRKGLWYSDTPNTIVFSNTDKLIDGQKRLMAIILSNEPQTMNIIKGMPEEAFKYIDRGQPRSVAGDFEALKIPNARAISTMLRKYLALKNSNLQIVNHSIPQEHFKRAPSIRNSTAKSAIEVRDSILDEYELRPADIQTITQDSQSIYTYSGRKIQQTTAGAYILYALDFGRNYAEMMTDLFMRAAKGEMLSKGEPEYYLYRFVNDSNYTLRSLKEFHNTIMKCFFAYIQNKEIYLIRHLPSDEFIYLQDHLKQLSIAS